MLRPAPVRQAPRERSSGWTAGAGWEYAFAERWTVRAEYLFASFPTTNALGQSPAPVGQHPPRFLGPGYPARPCRRELQVLIAASAAMFEPTASLDINSPPTARRYPAASRRANPNGDTMSTTIKADNRSRAAKQSVDDWRP